MQRTAAKKERLMNCIKKISGQNLENNLISGGTLKNLQIEGGKVDHLRLPNRSITQRFEIQKINLNE